MATKNRTYLTNNGVKVKSGLEQKVANQLEEEGIRYDYEGFSLEWEERFPRAKCGKCGSKSVTQSRSYTPDFCLFNGVILETKGRLTQRDRKILLGVKRSNPELDIRIVFDKDNKIERRSATRYSDWARQKGFKAAFKGKVPGEWLNG